MQPFTISAKNLAAFNMPNVDLAAAWYLLHINYKNPWNIFPPIFNDFDRRQKRFVRLHIDQHKKTPQSFGKFSDGIGYVNVGRMQYWDQKTNITINADPDEVFELKNGKVAVVDYKTGRYSKGQDKLLPLYEAQLSIYCDLIEKLGRGEVQKTGLIYFEPVTDDDEESLLKCATKDGYVQPWVTTPVLIDFDRGKFSALLKVVRKLYDMSIPPVCNGNCRGDCEKIAELYHVVRGAELNRAEAAKQNHDGHFYRTMRRHALHDLSDALKEIHSEPEQHPAAVEFSVVDWWQWGADARIVN